MQYILWCSHRVPKWLGFITYLNAKLKKCVFCLVLTVFVSPALRKSKGSAFHSFGAAAWNERSPRVVCFEEGTASFRSVLDRRQYCPSQTDYYYYHYLIDLYSA